MAVLLLAVIEKYRERGVPTSTNWEQQKELDPKDREIRDDEGTISGSLCLVVMLSVGCDFQAAKLVAPDAEEMKPFETKAKDLLRLLLPTGALEAQAMYVHSKITKEYAQLSSASSSSSITLPSYKTWGLGERDMLPIPRGFNKGTNSDLGFTHEEKVLNMYQGYVFKIPISISNSNVDHDSKVHTSVADCRAVGSTERDLKTVGEFVTNFPDDFKHFNPKGKLTLTKQALHVSPLWWALEMEAWETVQFLITELDCEVQVLEVLQVCRRKIVCSHLDVLDGWACLGAFIRPPPDGFLAALVAIVSEVLRVSPSA